MYRTLDGGDTPLYQVQMTLTQTGSPTATTETNGDGLYEFALPITVQEMPPAFIVGTTTFANAGAMGVTVTTISRLDLVVEDGQVFWEVDNFPACP